MKVMIFKNIASEKNPSMHIYAQELLKNMPADVRSFSLPAKDYPILKHYLAKEFIYPKAAARNHADVNHIADHSYTGLLRGLKPERTVVTCHDLIPLIAPGSVSYPGRKRYWFNIKLLPRAAKIISISEFTKRTIIERFKNIEEDKIAVISYGVSDIFRPIKEKNALREKYNISKSSILHVGSSFKRKNVELILKILSRRKDWQFIKVGAFSRGQLNYITKNNLKERILHFPFINLAEREKLVGLYSCAGVLAYPSLYEGFGMPILEAMACGCPIVCSKIAPFAEIAKESAVFIDSQDAKGLETSIERILEDKDFKNHLTQKGISIAKKYSWKECAEKTYNIYEEIFR